MLFVSPPSSPFEAPSLLFHFLSSPLRFFIQTLYYSLLYFRGSAVKSSDPSSSIRLVCVSDTHTKKTTIPAGDVLIHAGDLADQGTATEIQDQIDWIASLPHSEKIMIAGNHDSFFDPRARRASDVHRSIDFHGIHYLQHSSVTLRFPEIMHRQLTFYGAPQIPACGGDDFAFQYTRDKDAWSDTIPRRTDILITHTPPRHHLDLPHGMGCEYLLREVWKLRPKVHVFGHVHLGYGRENVFWDEGQKAYERVCAREQVGLFRDFLDPFAWLDALPIVWYGVKGALWSQVWGGAGVGTLLINASLTYGSTGKLGNAAQIIDV
ncbi:MAG: hypothetical protein LQ343_002538 [Gyalolechia ehrenbergii]|nr:MAG: hypothetical protein LQ343_002538 [Gyalolechia ehrenbergii]